MVTQRPHTGRLFLMPQRQGHATPKLCKKNGNPGPAIPPDEGYVKKKKYSNETIFYPDIGGTGIDGDRPKRLEGTGF